MEREKVERILRFYRNIDDEIKHNIRILQEYEDHYYIMRGGITFDCMPKSKYKKASPTEAIALNIPDSISTAMRDLREKNELLGELKKAILNEFDKLSHIKKTIIYNFDILGLQWIHISNKAYYSERQCRNIRYTALENLSEYFSKSDIIKNFNYPK